MTTVHLSVKIAELTHKDIKITNSNIANPREYLYLDNIENFQIFQVTNPKKPDMASVIERLVALKNNDNVDGLNFVPFLWEATTAMTS